MKTILLRKLINHEKLILFILLGIFTAYYTYNIGQDSNFDLLNYHFFTGYSYLTDRSGDIAPANIQTFTHPAVNILAYFAFDNIIFPYNAWLILLVQLMSIPALLLIADEISLMVTGKKISLEKNIALLICAISPLWLSELGTSFFSSTTAPLVLWSLYFILKENKNKYFEGFIAGSLMGLALGLKLTNAPFVIGSAFAVILKSTLTKSGRLNFFLTFVFGGLTGILLTSGWYWELWSTWKSPLFPFYNKIFQSPYFDLINWRDNRWAFNSIKEYIKFIVDANILTNKTSEVPFKDSRILLISIAPFILLLKPKELLQSKYIIFLTFFYVSYFLWSLLFAYQRYAIPLEIMYGLVIWITILSITRNKLIRKIALSLIALLCLFNFHVPNWGHLPANKITKDPFGITLPRGFDNTPARYLVDGVTISYTLRYLNQDSQFFGIRFTHQVDELIKQELKKPSTLPLRIITTENEIKNLPLVLDRFALHGKKLSCKKFSSNAGHYVICSVSETSNSKESTNNAINVSYAKSASNADVSPLVYAEGLSDYEENGRWSNGGHVEWTWPECINSKKLLFSITGSAYGPNVGKKFLLHIANQKFSFIMQQNSTTQNIEINNPKNECIKYIKLDIPAPTSPKELNESSDSRKLGILVKTLSLTQK